MKKTGAQIMRLLDNLTRQVDKNLILVTHSKENVVHADRILELHDGCLVEVENNKQPDKVLVQG
jgi:putative ABC transport system ATP-binding protein